LKSTACFACSAYLFSEAPAKEDSAYFSYNNN